MIAAFDDVKKIFRCHFGSHFLEKVERTKCVARSLDKQDWRSQFAQDFVPKFLRVAAATERIAKTDHAIHRLFQRKMAANTAAHAFPYQDHALLSGLSRFL